METKIEKVDLFESKIEQKINGSGHASNICKSIAQSAGSHGIANLPSSRNLSNEIHP